MVASNLVQALAQVIANSHKDWPGRTRWYRPVKVTDRVHAEAIVTALRANTPQGAALRTALLGLTAQQWGCAKTGQPDGTLYPYEQWALRETAEHQLARETTAAGAPVVLVVRDVGPWREACTDD